MATKIDELKEKYLSANSKSEELFNISSPPPYQCGYIDEIVDEIQRVQLAINLAIDYKNRGDNDGVETELDEARYYITYLDDRIESLRRSVEAIRDWGLEWKDFAKNIVNDNDIELSDYIEESISYKGE